MCVDLQKVGKAAKDIEKEMADIHSLIDNYTDNEITGNIHYLKSLKLSVIQITEAIGIILQHLLARVFKESVDGYQTVMDKARERKIISEDLYLRLKKFVRFRNMLVHGYWKVDNQTFLKNMRKGIKDFSDFLEEIKDFVAGLDCVSKRRLDHTSFPQNK